MMADDVTPTVESASRRVSKTPAAAKAVATADAAASAKPAPKPVKAAAPAKPRRVAKPSAASVPTAADVIVPAPQAAAIEPAPALLEPVVEPVIEPVIQPVFTAGPAAIVAEAPTQEGPMIMTETVTETVTEAAEKAKTVTTETIKDATAKMTEALHDMTAKAKTAMEKLTELTKDAVEFNKANVEAMVESGKVAVKGAQTAAQHAADYGRKNIEDTTAMVKSIGTVKAPADLLKIQGDFARSQFDSAVAELSKSTEFYLKLAGEVFQPISTRYSVVADQVKARVNG